jgi:F0F1-type ATP synthase assembly protein I
VQFAVSLVAFYYLGQWLDRRFGTAPVFLLVCVFVGAGASFYAMYRQLMEAQRRDEAARRADAEAARRPRAGREGGA